MCIQEKGRLKMEMRESAILTTQENRTYQAKFKRKNKFLPKGDIKKESKCFFCKRTEHMKKDCDKFKKRLEKKDKSISLVTESKMIDVKCNTWWIDSGSTIHISNSLQGLDTRNKMQSELRT